MSSNQPAAKPLITSFSILLLTGFLAGLLVHEVAPVEFRPYVYIAAVFGILAYVGLKWSSERRQRERDEQSIEQQRSQVESRLEQHAPLSKNG